MPLEELDDDQRSTLFALGVARGNIHYGFAMMSTLFVREHNRVADAIAAAEPGWDDERLFQTARNVMIVLLMKIVVEDYINHITPFHFRLFVEPGWGGGENWYRENWMSVEFNLLYRWHSLVPGRITVRGQEHKTADVRWNNRFVIEGGGLGKLFDEASRQPAGEIGLLNTPDFLVEIERKTIDIGRKVQLASYNDYREACTYPRLKSFAEVSSNAEVQARLRRLYRTVDDIELYVGLFAEDVREFAALPTLMGTMVGGDAFSQALTNPLLSKNIFKEATFSATGIKVIEQTQRLADLVARNIPPGQQPLVTLTQESWRHG